MPRTPRQRPLLSEEGTPSRGARVARRGVAGALIVLVAGGTYLGLRGSGVSVGGPQCQAVTGGTTIDFEPEQMGNAATIVAIAMKRGLPARAATIGVATAIQESKLRNLRYGDRDSLGLFQQRPSQGWGTQAQLLDPEYATNAFYDALVKIKGYQSMEITKVAQAVQRSAAPEAYADHEQEGRVLADVISGYTPKGMGCRLEAGTTSGAAATVRTALTKELGMTPTVSGRTLTVAAVDDRHAWAVGSWSVARAEAMGVASVVVGSSQWTRARGSEAYTWSPAKDPAPASTVRITLA